MPQRRRRAAERFLDNPSEDAFLDFLNASMNVPPPPRYTPPEPSPRKRYLLRAAQLVVGIGIGASLLPIDLYTVSMLSTIAVCSAVFIVCW